MLEIEELRRAFQGAGNLPFGEMDRLVLTLYREDFGSRLDLEARLDEAQVRFPFAAINDNKRIVQRFKKPDVESTFEKIVETLEAAEKLCRASMSTGTPIRMMW